MVTDLAHTLTPSLLSFPLAAYVELTTADADAFMCSYWPSLLLYLTEFPRK